MNEPTELVRQFHTVPSFVDTTAWDSQPLHSPSHAFGRHICAIGSAPLVYFRYFLRQVLRVDLRPVSSVNEKKNRLQHKRIETRRSRGSDLFILNGENWKNPGLQFLATNNGRAKRLRDTLNG